MRGAARTRLATLFGRPAAAFPVKLAPAPPACLAAGTAADRAGLGRRRLAERHFHIGPRTHVIEARLVRTRGQRHLGATDGHLVEGILAWPATAGLVPAAAARS